MFFPKKMIGIDIGTSSVKLVEISRWGKGSTLENYGELLSEHIYRENVTSGGKIASRISTEFVAQAIKDILQEAKVKTKEVIFSLPDFSTFSTSFEIPSMPEKEIPGAIQYNASQYITLPISEVTLDWKIISGNPAEKNALLKVFLVAVPNQTVKEYQSIAHNAGLELYALEAEAFCAARSLLRGTKKTVLLMDIGVQSSTITIIDNGFLQRSYSFNFYSKKLAQQISSALSIDVAKAREITEKEGILSSKPNVAQTLYLLIDPLLKELEGISAEFFQQERKQVEEIYLTGGTANLPGLKEYFAERLKKSVFMPNCFADLLYPPILEERLKEMSPRFSVAVGSALGGLEK